MSGEIRKRYDAFVWDEGPDVPGKRVSIWAASATEARELLVKRYGKGNVFYIHNKEDLEKPR